MHRTALEDRRTGPVEGLRKPASILCPVDFSDESLATLARAMEIANRSGARLVALHVADPLLARAAAAAYHRSVVIEESTRALRDAVDHVRWETGSGNVDIAVKVALGDTASEICRFCRDHAVDLIVMGSHASGTYRVGVLVRAPNRAGAGARLPTRPSRAGLYDVRPSPVRRRSLAPTWRRANDTSAIFRGVA
jgi:nucleotide-binding universal stress UspA family protein